MGPLRKIPASPSALPAKAAQDNVIISRVAEIAQQRGVTMTEVSLAWLLSKVTSPVVGATFSAIAGVGFWRFVRNGIPNYIFFRAPFAFLDYDKSAVLVFAENLASLITFVFSGAACASIVRARTGKGKVLMPVILVLIAAAIGAALLLCTA